MNAEDYEIEEGVCDECEHLRACIVTSAGAGYCAICLQRMIDAIRRYEKANQ